jgi:NAD(P)-dependent dehydrogenase (short-subunit alcohol dehydrogenase family)
MCASPGGQRTEGGQQQAVLVASAHRAFYTARVFLSAMVERGSGTLIFTSSGAAVHTEPGWSAYCAAKAGLDHFVRNLAAELHERGSFVRPISSTPASLILASRKWGSLKEEGGATWGSRFCLARGALSGETRPEAYSTRW